MIRDSDRQPRDIPATPGSGAKIYHPDVDTMEGYQIRLSGGGNEDEGFVEMYNVTERRWAIICDKNFNDFTGEVCS